MDDETRRQCQPRRMTACHGQAWAMYRCRVSAGIHLVRTLPGRTLLVRTRSQSVPQQDLAAPIMQQLLVQAIITPQHSSRQKHEQTLTDMDNFVTGHHRQYTEVMVGRRPKVIPGGCH